MPNQRTRRANMVPKGTAPLLFSPQMKRLSTWLGLGLGLGLGLR